MSRARFQFMISGASVGFAVQAAQHHSAGYILVFLGLAAWAYYLGARYED